MSDNNFAIDPVTGSYNEDWLCNIYNHIIANKMKNYALLSLKIKRFAQINRAYGRVISNSILKSVYDEINKWLLPEEYCVRLYAGHFNLLLKLDSIDTINKRVIEMIINIRENSSFEPIRGHVFVGVGVYRLTDDEKSFYIAQYNADDCRKGSLQKSYRNSHYEIYGYSYINEAECFVDLQDKILPAIKNGCFKLYLQPKVNLITGEITAAEALMRWIDPVDGEIPINSFMSGLEENGFIRNVDLYIFEQVCINLRKWMDAYNKDFIISVNLSKAYFEDDRFVSDYTKVLNKYNISPEYIEIEFIENIVMNQVDRLNDVAKKLYEVGFKCSVDDFGSGYSSFNVLANLNLDELKIDRSLFTDIHNKKEKIVIHQIINLAKRLNVKTVAEGVETMEYVNYLREIGCDYVQGYVFYKPLPVNEFEQHFIINDEKAILRNDYLIK